MIQNEVIHLDLISVPEHTSSRTLLGVNFVRATDIVINVKYNSYFSIENPHEMFHSIHENETVSPCEVNAVNFMKLALRKGEGLFLKSEERDILN